MHSFTKQHLSVETRRLLCAFATGEPDRTLPRVEYNWEELLQAVRRNGLVGLTQRYLTQAKEDSALPASFRQAVQHAHYVNSVGLALMYRGIAKILTALGDAGLDFLVLKGPALAKLVYPSPMQRTFGDLDLMVRERDMERAHLLLVAAGFTPEVEPLISQPKVTNRVTTYELKYWHPEWRMLVEMHYDDLLNAGLASRDVEGFYRRAIDIEIAEVNTRTLCLEDQLLHLCAHMHYHGYVRLNWFSDIALLIRDHGDRIDWASFLATTVTEEAQVPVYYSLYFLDEILGVSVPTGILAALRPDRFRRWCHEKLMPERAVVALEPAPRPDFSFYFTPLVKRLLPDLLVMGRRPEKLRYLLRLLIPPAPWLRMYYDLPRNAFLPLHYLLHPLKLGGHYLAEVAGCLIGRGYWNEGETEALPVAREIDGVRAV